MDLCQISHGKLSPAVTNFNNTIVTNSNPNRWWLIVGGKLIAAIGPISYIFTYCKSN